MLRKFNRSIPVLILVAIVSNFKNLFVWENFNAFSNEFFHYSIIDFGLDESLIFLLMIVLVIWTLPVLIWESTRRLFLLFSGIINILIPLSDLLILHHDMLFSGILFLLGALYAKENLDHYPIKIFILSVYLSTGLAKLTLDFFDGSVIEMILSRINLDIFPEYFYIIFAFTAAGLEIIIPLLYIFQLKNRFFVTIILLSAILYHLLLLSTGTGTLFNLIYASLFCTTVYQQVGNKPKLLDRIAQYSSRFATFFIYIYSSLYILKNSVYDLWMKY